MTNKNIIKKSGTIEDKLLQWIRKNLEEIKS